MFELSVSDKEFKEIRALSYSKISSFEKDGPSSLVMKKDISDKEYIIFGKLVDTMLLTPENLNEYQVENYTKERPGPKETEILKRLIEIKKNKELDDETVLSVCSELDYYKKYLPSTRLNKIKSYFDYMKFIDGERKIVTQFMWNKAEKVVNLIKTSSNTKHFFELSEFERGYNQVNLITEYEGQLVKGALDRLIVDDYNKTFQIIDLKTGSVPSSKFIDQFWNFNYWIQSTLYTVMLEDIISRSDKYNEYKIKDFVFVYVSSSGDGIPAVLTVENNRISSFENGFYKGKSEWRNKGLKDLIREIVWHYDNQIFDTDYDFMSKNGCLTIGELQVRGDEE